MTKLRDPVTIENTLLMLLGTISIERAAEVTGRATGYVRNLSNPDTRERLALEDAISLDLEWRAQGNEGYPLLETYDRILHSNAADRFADATALATITLLMAAPAHASGSSMPWEEPLQKILESIEGPVAKIVAVIIIITTGLTLAFGDTAGGFRRLVQIVFGLSIAFAASSFFLSFFSFGGGALV